MSKWSVRDVSMSKQSIMDLSMRNWSVVGDLWASDQLWCTCERAIDHGWYITGTMFIKYFIKMDEWVNWTVISTESYPLLSLSDHAVSFRNEFMCLASGFMCHSWIEVPIVYSRVSINVTLINVKSPYLLRKVSSQGCAN
jgi:hypothetical protein